MTITTTVPEYGGDVPKRTQSQTDFNQNVQDMLDYQATLAPNINDVASEMNTEAQNSADSATASATSASESEISNLQSAASASASASSANATIYDNIATYDTGDTVIGSDANTYRCLSDGISGDDPVDSITGEWVVLTLGATSPHIKIANFNAVPTQQYLVNTTLAVVTATLPIAVLAGHTVNIADYAGTFSDFNCTINRNGHNIMGLAEDMILDISNASTSLVYVDTTQGWRLI